MMHLNPVYVLFVKVKLTQPKIIHFYVNNSVAFNTFAMLCNHHLYLVPGYFHHPKRKPCIH